jgi:hypothetical protein
MERIENTASQLSIVAYYESVEAITWQQLLFTEPLPSSCCCIDADFAAVD